jgi:hypothetical protein
MNKHKGEEALLARTDYFSTSTSILAVNKSKRPRKNCQQYRSASSTSSLVLPWALNETMQRGKTRVVSSTVKILGKTTGGPINGKITESV